uniref:Uncharacterized protein n=1 Tax=Siphoviridae sp. ctnLs3 TaxID=2827937 RepID=A0A8S5TDT5_9CAUD|nr:MAG TPA: hypothetical protein [Siphoviridae sp. ctnLs3]
MTPSVNSRTAPAPIAGNHRRMQPCSRYPGTNHKAVCK